MARPSRCRRICREPEYDLFSPVKAVNERPFPSEAVNGKTVVLSVDEYEVLRLIDYERKTHEECGALMDISRTTVTEMYEKARYKVADCIVNGKCLRIAGGNYRICDGSAKPCGRDMCRRRQRFLGIPSNEPLACISDFQEKGENKMRVAVTYENGMIFQHFGHTEQFKVYDIENGAVVSSKVVDTMGSGHGALAGILAELKADVLICGGIGAGAQTALAEVGIKLYGGVSGEADKAVEDFIKGNLGYDPNVHCDHHDHDGEHSCGEHSCGDHHGCTGNH